MIMFPYTISQPDLSHLNPGDVSTSKRIISVKSHNDSSGDLTEIATDNPENTEATTKRKCIGILKEIFKILTKSGDDNNTFLPMIQKSKDTSTDVDFYKKLQGFNFRNL